MLSAHAKLGSVAGARVSPFGTSFCPGRRPSTVAHAQSGANWTLGKGRPYLFEIEVSEDEPEELAIRRYQRMVTQTLLLPELRRRRRVMTKIEALQSKQNEKGLIKKLNIDPPTWVEHHGSADDAAAPFADYFQTDMAIEDCYSPDRWHIPIAGEDTFFADLKDSYPDSQMSDNNRSSSFLYRETIY